MLEGVGQKVKLTREVDIEDDGLNWRAEIAAKFHADIFISIHCNSAENPEAHGTEVWYYPGSEAGRDLACSIQAALVQNCHTTDRGVKTNDTWAVLKATDCPAVLVEMAFISNEEERGLLTDCFLQRLFAVGITQGVCQFFRIGPLLAGNIESPAKGDI